MQSVVVVQL